MPDKRPPEFTKDEMRVSHDTLNERVGYELESQLNTALAEMTLCPIVSPACCEPRPMKS